MNPVDSWQLTVDNWEGHGKVYAYIAVAVLLLIVFATWKIKQIHVFFIHTESFFSYGLKKTI